MIANGHNWSSIKTYTLSEVGTFFKTIVIMERERKAQSISENWQANNLTLEGLKDVLKELGVKTPSKKKKDKGPSVSEVNNEWKRLKNFMSKQGK